MRRHASALLFNAGSVVAVLGLLIPWAQVARDPKNGFELAGVLIDLPSLGVEPSTETIGIAWYALPILLLLAWASFWLAHPPRATNWTIALTFAPTLLAVVCWAALYTGSELLRVRAGPAVTSIGALLMSAAALWNHRRAGADAPTAAAPA